MKASDGLRYYVRKPDGYMEGDNEYSHRAYLDMVHFGLVLFPGKQYKPPENKNDFVRLLNEEIAYWKAQGAVFRNVKVTVGGKPGWEFVP